MDNFNANCNKTDPTRDILGNPLNVGDLVVYSASGSGRLAIAEVVEFTRKKIRLGYPSGNYTWLAGPDRIVKAVYNA